MSFESLFYIGFKLFILGRDIQQMYWISDGFDIKKENLHFLSTPGAYKKLVLIRTNKAFSILNSGQYDQLKWN